MKIFVKTANTTITIIYKPILSRKAGVHKIQFAV